MAASFDFEFETLGDGQLSNMLAFARGFCAAMQRGDRPYWFVLLGNSGTGKTHLARRIIRYFNRHVSLFRDPETRAICERHGGLKNWNAAMRDMIEGDFSGVRQLSGDWLVALDDIGTEYEKHANLAATKLYEIMVAREDKWTVITANLSLAQIADRVDTRIASRLTRNNSAVIDVNVTEFNLRHA